VLQKEKKKKKKKKEVDLAKGNVPVGMETPILQF